MKKIILLCVFLLCGCSKDKLVCTYNTDYEDIKIDNKIVFDFETGKYEQVDKMIFEDSISASSYFNDIEEYKEEYNLNLESNIIISNIIDEIKLDGTREDIKKQYESYDYKCK